MAPEYSQAEAAASVLAGQEQRDIRRWDHMVQTGIRRVVAEPQQEHTAMHTHRVLAGSPVKTLRAWVAAATESAHIQRPLATRLPRPFPRSGLMMADCLEVVSLRAVEPHHNASGRLSCRPFRTSMSSCFCPDVSGFAPVDAEAEDWHPVFSAS